MHFKFAAFIKTTVMCGAITIMMTMTSWAEDVIVDLDKPVTKNLEDKLYRQALYFYFMGNYDEALRKISINRQRFNANSARSQLFEAGLQVSVGLHHQATQTLNQLENMQRRSPKSTTLASTDKGESATSPEELLLIALLQLAEQQIQQGESHFAQQSLGKIRQVPQVYRDQYYILNQLAYWPEAPMLLAEIIEEKEATQQSSDSAYVELNKALMHIEQGEFELAEILLTTIKNKRWPSTTPTFWQLLFTPFSNKVESDNAEQKKTEVKQDKQNQQQAINDYAQLLLAQLYVKQTRYEAAYYELKDFPQDSPYTETALFIFAFSAQKTKQYTTSLKLFDLMQERFPYSNLGWQSALLLAGQITEQQTIEQGMTSYQQAERLYQQRLADLANFQHDFTVNDNVLTFAATQKPVTAQFNEGEQFNKAKGASALFNERQQTFNTDSVWLQKALHDVELQADYQAVIDLDLLTTYLQTQQKTSHWLQDTLNLNKERKAKILALQQHAQYSAMIAELNDEKIKISSVISQAETEQQSHVFAEPTEARWLKRITESKQAISAIENSRSTDDYQERLTRIESVLTWQLQQLFPERLWHHKKQLKAIEQQLVIAEQQQKRFSALVASSQRMPDLENRIIKSATDVIDLLNKTAQLRVTTSKKIRLKVQHFVESQRSVLEQHLLLSRHEMAAILERMSQVDKRIERQLTPSVAKPEIAMPTSKEQQ